MQAKLGMSGAFPPPPSGDRPAAACLPARSSQALGWQHLQVEQFRHPPGECSLPVGDDHTICLSLAARPVRFLQIKNGKTHSSLYGKGDISITPAQTPFFARWDDDDHYVELRLDPGFMATVAQESLALNPDRIELIPEFRLRDGRLEAIALMLLDELRQANPGGQLYVESLTNLLAVHLLRHYATTTPRAAAPGNYSGGLPHRQLVPVLDYIHDQLDGDLKLVDLAAIAGLSPYHFSHLFKRSMGMAPHQYVLHQRIERAKQLLRQSDRPIVEIALGCGFSSHSHLSQQFRRATGSTPSAYRAIAP
jgi:AraC family transcriptional regulator